MYLEVRKRSLELVVETLEVFELPLGGTVIAITSHKPRRGTKPVRCHWKTLTGL
jgi:hypothetical protein